MSTKRLLLVLFWAVLFSVGLVGCLGLESTLTTPTQAGDPDPTEPATPTRQPSPTAVKATTQEAPVTETTSPQIPENQPDNPFVQQAKEDLAERLKIDIERIELLAFELVTWSDSSLGCPQPGMAYPQVPVDGAVIRLAAGDQTYEYHTGGTRSPFLCEQNLEIPNLKPTLPKIDLLVTPTEPEND